MREVHTQRVDETTYPSYTVQRARLDDKSEDGGDSAVFTALLLLAQDTGHFLPIQPSMAVDLSVGEKQRVKARTRNDKRLR